MELKICTRCQLKTPDEFLREIAHSQKHSLKDILKQAQQDDDSYLNEESRKHTKKREQEIQAALEQYEIELSQLDENASYDALDNITQGKDIEDIAADILEDEKRKELRDKINVLKWNPEGMTEEDTRKALDEFERQGLIQISEGNIRITSVGAKRLASNALEKILKNLASKELGVHSIDKAGFGSDMTAYTRHYEAGDDYSLVDIERTSLNALERSGRLEFELGDFEVHEEVHQSRLCAGLLIDESGSMKSSDKLEAAIDSALALSELIRREPKDSLRIFLFADRVKEIRPWELVNEVMEGDTTDIKSALRTFRESVRSDRGDKQAYLITDTDPNTEDGKYLGFDKASASLIEEALRYRLEGIGLNIIMLDDSPRLKQLASTLAIKNLGRVFFVSPQQLGQLVIEDYLRAKRDSF